ncbi:aa3-type cytochrome c oxidase subunit IV [Roseovarius sp. SYSU LYC5161]|nr:aa3-type cytochrome c oxidase subunit IV [Roseovarius sp.]
MAEHKHGEMDIEVQEKTFEGFVKAISWGAVLTIALLILIALINA